MAGLFTDEERTDPSVTSLNRMFTAALEAHGADMARVIRSVERAIAELPAAEQKALRERLALIAHPAAPLDPSATH